MKRQVAAQTIDPLLLPLMQTSGESELQNVCSQLISEHAEPIIKKIVSYKLHVYGSHTATVSLGQDAEDICGEVLVELLARLRDFKADPQDKAIGDFRSYVAVTAYHACYSHLRRKYPERWKLKNRLRYLLTHNPELALWKSADDDWLCGLGKWRNREKASRHTERLWRLHDDADAFIQTRLQQDLHRKDPAGLVSAIFDWVGCPIELDDLVNIVAVLWGIKDQAPSIEIGDEGMAERNKSLIDPRASIASEIDQRFYLQRLWAEICLLPARQRAALLLNLKDEKGNDLTTLLPVIGVATLRQIAEALEMPAESLAILWKNLPLDDASIARRLGLTRQQIINLRKSARERLARRMEAF
jgi:RNA polymerase sigma factor (sigma-70 family)